MRAERFLHSQLMYMVNYFPYTTRACCCVGRHGECHSPRVNLCLPSWAILPLLSGIVLSYYSHFPKFLSVKHGIERRITAQTEKLWILPTENHICNAQRTHSKTGSTLRLIYHSPHFTTAHRFLFLARRKKLPQMTIQLYLALYDYCRAAYHTRRFATSKTTY